MAKLENTPSAKRKCVGCGAELAGNTPPDLCPKCLLKLALETQPLMERKLSAQKLKLKVEFPGSS